VVFRTQGIAPRNKVIYMKCDGVFLSVDGRSIRLVLSFVSRHIRIDSDFRLLPAGTGLAGVQFSVDGNSTLPDSVTAQHTLSNR
jgi:hypothetical protein